MMYVQDYDETYPPSYVRTTQSPPPDGYWWVNYSMWFWPQIIYPYHHSHQVLFCPSSAYTVTGTITSSMGKPIANTDQYGVNVMLFPPPVEQAASSIPAVKMAAVQSPASTYMIMDAGNYVMAPVGYMAGISPVTGSAFTSYYLPGRGSLAGSPAYTNTGTEASNAREKDYMDGRHFHGLNIAFADGHAKWLRSSEVYNQARKCTDCGFTLSNGTHRTEHNAASAWNPFSSH